MGDMRVARIACAAVRVAIALAWCLVIYGLVTSVALARAQGWL